MPTTSTPAERSLRGKIAVETSWANTVDRPARTAPARRGLEAKFLAEAGGDPARAEHIRKAFYARLALKSAQARRRRAGKPEESAEPLSPTEQATIKRLVDAAPRLTPAERDKLAVLLEPVRREASA
jgi:hypothetical protein